MKPRCSRTLLALAPILALALSTACRTTHARESAPPQASLVREEAEPLPAWAEEPLSEAKLRQIELWLATQDEARPSPWRVEGELQLALGRVDLARRQLAAAKDKNQDPALVARARTARTALEQLARDERADATQRERAADALPRADKLLADLGRASAPLGVPVIARASWGALPAKSALMTKNTGGWKKITVHHSAEAHPTPLDGSTASSAAALRLIQRSHLKSKQPPWGDIGYHFLIDPQGRVFQGRELAWQGAHAKGDNNIQNLGVCLLGNFDEERPGTKALESLRSLLEGLRRTYRIPRGEVHAHADFRNTDCPGKFLKPWVVSYQKGASEPKATLQATAKKSSGPK